jgi:hypothetical protein
MAAWAVVTSVLRVGAAPVSIQNEAREGVYARAMLDSGNEAGVWDAPDGRG